MLALGILTIPITRSYTRVEIQTYGITYRQQCTTATSLVRINFNQVSEFLRIFISKSELRFCRSKIPYSIFFVIRYKRKYKCKYKNKIFASYCIFVFLCIFYFIYKSHKRPRSCYQSIRQNSYMRCDINCSRCHRP